MLGDVGAPVDHLGVAPHGVVDHAGRRRRSIQYEASPLRGQCVRRAAGLEQVAADVAPREVVHGQVALLEQVTRPSWLSAITSPAKTTRTRRGQGSMRTVAVWPVARRGGRGSSYC